MTASLARRVTTGSLAAALWFGSVCHAEPTPAASNPSTPPGPPSASAPRGKVGRVIGNVDEQELQRKKEAADAVIKSDPAPVSKEAIKRQDKAKAVQTGDDATLRDLPSPANKGTE